MCKCKIIWNLIFTNDRVAKMTKRISIDGHNEKKAMTSNVYWVSSLAKLEDFVNIFLQLRLSWSQKLWRGMHRTSWTQRWFIVHNRR